MAEKQPILPTDEAMKAKALSRWEGEGGAPVEGRKPKRPRDLNRRAKHIAGLATGQIEDREPTPEEEGKDPIAVKRGKAGGVKGRKARPAKMTAQERSEAARLGGTSPVVTPGNVGRR